MDKNNFAKSSSYEKLMEAVSGTGRYQNLLLALTLFRTIVSPFLHTGSVFLAGLPPSRCMIDAIDNVSGSALSQDFITKTFIPYNKYTKGYDRCKRFEYDLTSCGSNITEACVTKIANETKVPKVMSCQDGFYFDNSTFEETITTEWELVCDKLILMTTTSSIYYLGLFFGAIVGGMLSDRYGRVRVCQGFSILWFVFSLSLAFSPNVYVFLALRFLLAFSYMPLSVASFVYITEISKKFLRPTLGCLYNVAFGFGCVVMSGLAYKWRHWRDLEIVFSLWSIPVIFIVFCILPKSPRWLISKGRSKEAHKICEVMARRNKGELPETLFQEAQQNVAQETQSSSKELLRLPYLRLMLLCNCFVWCVTSLVYYGLALNSGALSGSVYLNHALGGVMELTACLMTIPMLLILGRRRTTVGTLAVSSVSCLLSTVCIQLSSGNDAFQKAGIVTAMVGRFSSSATFAAVYQQTVELFPTPGRGTAMGVASMAARIGSIITPYTLQLQYELPWLTQTIFGVAAAFAALLASCFPETNGRPLLSSFKESEEFLGEHLRHTWIGKLCCLARNGESRDSDVTKEIPLMTISSA